MSKYSNLVNGIHEVLSPIEGREDDMVQNNAGGYTFTVTPENRLLRFLILGADGATYYADARDHFRQAYEGVENAIKQLGVKAVDMIVSVSKEGRAPKQDATIFALALCAARGDADTRARVFNDLHEVCRIPTHLFSFLSDYKTLGGKTGGRQVKRTLQNWYTSKSPEDLAYHLVKYRQRGGWTHRDVLRLCKPAAGNTAHGELFAWVTGKSTDLSVRNDHMRLIVAYEMLKDETLSCTDTANFVTEYGLPREAIPDVHLKNAQVWRALLRAGTGMPMTAMIRNLNRMTAAGVFASEGNADTDFVCRRLTDENLLRGARVHPIQVLSAYRTYAKGSGHKGGDMTWTPVQRISTALYEAFLKSFKNVETTGKRYYVGLDVSGSMTMGDIAGVPGLTPREASAAMALLWAKTEPACIVKGFTSNGDGYWARGTTGLTDLTQDFKRESATLDSVTTRVGSLQFGATQPALIIGDALKNKITVDVFVIMTDNEVNSGEHPAKVLEQYRMEMNPNAKLVVVGMTATEFTLADPEDTKMLDMVGFDAGGVTAIQEFVKS